MKDKEILPTITIKRIKEQVFIIQENLLQDTSRLIKIEISQNLAFALEANLVDLTLRIYYHFPDDSDTILVDISVQNLFEITDLKSFMTNGTEIKLPPMVIASIVGLSISHTRALLAKNLFGTVLQDSLPAIVNSEEVARHFFPRMFEIATTKPLLEGANL